MPKKNEPIMSIQVTEERLAAFTQEVKTMFYEAMNIAAGPRKDVAQELPEEKGEEKTSLENDIKTFLELDNFKDVKTEEEEVGCSYRRKLIGYHLHRFIQTDRFVIHSQNNYLTDKMTRSGEKWGKLRLSRDLVLDAPWGLSFYVEDKILNFKFVLEVDFGDYMNPRYSVHTRKNDLVHAKQFYKDFQDEYTFNNILKNKNITFVATQSGVHPVIMDVCDIDENSVFVSPENSKEIETNVFNLFLKKDLYKENGIPLKRGLIFSGPPGCGKTMTIKKVMKKLSGQVTVISVTSKSVSHSNTISSIFEFAKDLAPSVVIFEDIDLLGESRDSGSFSAYVGELLAQLDGLEKMENMVIIATTNYPEKLDAALSNRPSRFDRHLKFDLPIDELKIKILENELKLFKQDARLDLNNFKEQLKHMSGALIKEIAVTAALLAIESDSETVISDTHIKDAINKIHENFTVSKRSDLGF